MSSLFLFLAVVGGGIALMQVVGSLIGLAGHDGVEDHEHESGTLLHEGAHGSPLDVFQFRSVRAIAAGVGFTGLGGIVALRSVGSGAALALAMALGLAIYLFVAFVMGAMRRLESDRTLKPSAAIGLDGVVSLPVGPALAGKVRLAVGGRQVEWPAVLLEARDGPSVLPSGTPVLVVEMKDDVTLSVVALDAQYPEIA